MEYEIDQEPADAPDRAHDPAGPVEQPGNTEPDEETVKQGEEQLDRIVGN